MTNIVLNIPTLQIPVAPQQPQVQNNAASGNNAQSGNQAGNTQSSQNTQSQQTQNNNSSDQANSAQGNNASQNGNANSAPDQNNHFSKLLANNQPANTSSAPAAKQTSGKTDTSQTDTGNIGAVVAYIAAQLQAQPLAPQDNTDAGTDAVTAANGNSSSSTSNAALLQQLKQLLQQALAATDSSPQQTGSDTAATGLVAANDVSANAGAIVDTAIAGTASADSDASLKKTLDQLIALLQGNSAASVTAVATAAAPVTTATSVAQDSSAAQSTNTDVSAVIKLAQALEDKLNATQSTAATATETTQTATATAIANAVIATPNTNTPKSKVADVTDSTTQPVTSTVTNNTTDTSTTTENSFLQSAVTQLSGFIANNHGKTSSSNITDDSILSTSISSQIANANNIGANVANTNNNSQAPSTGNNDFSKFLPSATANTQVSDQVLVQIRNQANQGASQIRIQLQPEDLGKVTVQMNTGTDGKTGVTVTADNRQTLSMLQSDARHLEAALRNIGIKTSSGGLSFNLSGQQQQNQQNPAKQGGYTQIAAATTIDDDSDYYGTVVASYRMSAQQGLDIRV